jgi:hypothetical protein
MHKCSLARKQEKALWQNVPNLEITTFRNADGDDIDVPNFISAWDNSVPRTKEAKDEVDICYLLLQNLWNVSEKN